MKSKVLSIVISLISLFLNSQNSKQIDSLLQSPFVSKSDTIKIKQINRLILDLKHTDQAITYSRLMLEKSKVLNYNHGIFLAYCNLGAILASQANYYDALVYFNKAAALKKNDQIYYVTALDGIGDIYINLDSLDKARAIYKKCLQINAINNDTLELFFNYKQLGNIEYLMNRFDTAIYYFNKSLTISKSVSKYTAKINLKIGLCYLKLNQYNKAEAVMKSSLDTSLKYNFINVVSESASELEKYYSSKNDFKNAYKMNLISKQYQDSLRTNETKDLIMKLKYDQIDEERRAEQEKKDIIAVANLKEKEMQRNYSAGGFCLILLFFIVMSRAFYHKNQQKKLIEKQKQLVDEKQKEIIDSINYAKGIQEAFVPTIEDDNVFVLYKPKDIVSGDFYWIAEKNGNKYYAVADCTGHGVPGALLSMLCTQLLNQALEVYVEPAHIISYVNMHLETKMKAMGRNDGMEIGLVCLNGSKIFFAGIKRPLYVVYNNQIEVIKPIDGENIKIETQSNMSIFMTSDGYSDQFGLDGKKFGSKRMKELMEYVSVKSTEKQKQIFESSIERWKGDVEQTDDILLMGIKF